MCVTGVSCAALNNYNRIVHAEFVSNFDFAFDLQFDFDFPFRFCNRKGKLRRCRHFRDRRAYSIDFVFSSMFSSSEPSTPFPKIEPNSVCKTSLLLAAGSQRFLRHHKFPLNPGLGQWPFIYYEPNNWVYDK